MQSTQDADRKFLMPRPGPRVEPTARWVRVLFAGETVADSRSALLLIQYGPGRLPTYFFPMGDVRMELLSPATTEAATGETLFWNVHSGERVAENGAWGYRDPSGELAGLRDHLSFSWGKMDAWYEEEEQVFVHARDPHKRVDVLESSRHIRIVVANQTVAETRHPFLLFETGLPTRFYIPPQDVRLDLLKPSDLVTQCPYKGRASYWILRLGEQEWPNIVWSYPDPIPENPKIRGLMCFFNEHVDTYVDGVLEDRPVTPWS